MKTIRVYADTSVFGGAFDPEFAPGSQSFFAEIRRGRLRLVVSRLVAEEIAGAPADVRQLFQSMESKAEAVGVSEDALRLARAYIEAGIVAPRWRADALHVAVATVERCSAIVSWNFKHIVHFGKVPLYSGVNLANGYGLLAIHSPLEVLTYEEEI